MRIDWDRVDRTKKKFKALGNSISKKLKDMDTYNREAPKRRKEEIKRLKDELQIEKLKQQKDKLRNKEKSGGWF